jgi:hypothetical protein
MPRWIIESRHNSPHLPACLTQEKIGTGPADWLEHLLWLFVGQFLFLDEKATSYFSMTYCNDLRSTSELDLKTYFKNLFVKQEILLNYLTRLLQMLESRLNRRFRLLL